MKLVLGSLNTNVSDDHTNKLHWRVATSGVTKGCAEGIVARGRSGRENAKQPQPWAPQEGARGSPDPLDFDINFSHIITVAPRVEIQMHFWKGAKFLPAQLDTQ